MKTTIFLLFAIVSTSLAGVGEDTLNNDPVFQEQEIRSQVQGQQRLEMRRMRAQYEEALQQQRAQCEQALQQMQAQYEQRISDLTAGQ